MAKHFFPLFAWGLIVSFYVLPLHGASAAATPTPENVRFVGAVTCQSSMCHGGASPSRDQFTIWSRQDFHSRAYATLVTARSVRIAESLGIASATKSNRCTSCHAPMAALPPDHLASTANATEGVSCETCHNGAADWLRSHTRPDLTHAERVQSGLRDLRSAYVRANTCVGCHQVLDPALLKAGHPELTFELDGQSASEPRHWTDKDAWFGPKAWLVGQAVALREISQQLEKNSNPDLVAQQDALVWLLQMIPGVHPADDRAGKGDLTAAWSNQVAQTISSQDWKPDMSVKTLKALSESWQSFRDDSVSTRDKAMRAERLVMGLDRLSKSLKKDRSGERETNLSALFADVQDRDQFNPKMFASQLLQFSEVVPNQ